ncbi:MAG: TonB-dependent receptor domain-containing protein [Tenacibaculum sp.]
MKKITLLFIFTSLFSFSQKQITNKYPPKVKLSGKVVEANTGEPLEYATIILTHLKSKKISGEITDIEGNFEVEVLKGNYAIKVEFIGFKTKNLANKTLTDNLNLGIIRLNEDAQALDEVEIIAEKSTVEIRLDKKIYNVGKDMTVKGGSASDVLDNVPSVNVDTEGTVSLRGNENVRILIDGKPSALVGIRGTDALKNLPAEAIEKVEVITSPSARYDAEGSAGILNIILRKGKIIGFNGSTNLSIGYPDKFGIAPNLNYRTKKINLFSNLGYNNSKSLGNTFAEFSYLTEGFIDSTQTEARVFDRKNINFNGSVGLEYYIDKNSSITGSFFYRNAKDTDIATNITQRYRLTNPELKLHDEIRIENENEKSIDKQYSLNYTNNFKGKGKKLSVDLQYGNGYSNELSPIRVNEMLTENNSQITSYKNTLFQIDYVQPLGENSQFELGHKSDLQSLDSDFKVRDGNDEAFAFDPSNAINFKQNIYAFYGQYGNKKDKFSYLLGLRTEITDVDLTVFTSDQFSDKNYTKWFPTLNLGYELNEKDNLTLGFSKRLRRPPHWFMNPFESRSSATNIFRGNPDINPSFTSSFDLGYTTKVNKLTLNSSIYYQYSTDIIQIVYIIEERNGTNVFVRQPTNLSTQNRYGFELTTNYNPVKWAQLSTSFNYFKFNTDAFSFVYSTSSGNQRSINLSAVTNSSWFARFNAKIKLPAKIQSQTRIFYRGPQETAQSIRRGNLIANLAFSKDLFKDKATLVLNVSNLFNSKRRSITYNGSRENPSSIAEDSFQWRGRQTSLNFTYRFNQAKKAQRTQRGSNYDDEQGDF